MHNKTHQVIQFFHSMLDLIFWIYCLRFFSVHLRLGPQITEKSHIRYERFLIPLWSLLLPDSFNNEIFWSSKSRRHKSNWIWNLENVGIVFLLLNVKHTTTTQISILLAGFSSLNIMIVFLWCFSQICNSIQGNFKDFS